MPYFARIDPGSVAVFIPILMVLGGVLIAIAAIFMNARKKDLEHRERLVALEKGLPLPEPGPVRVSRPAYASRRAYGLVMVGIGLSVWIATSVANGSRDGIWGLIPLFIGLGMLIASHLDKREYDAAVAREDGRGGAFSRTSGANAPVAPPATDPVASSDSDDSYSSSA